MIIYKITNRINGKVYIGQTIKSLKVRWSQHCTPNSNCRFLHNAIIKHGAINFTIEQIDVACSREELDQKEVYWIKYYDSMNQEKGYNLTSGGEHPIVSEQSIQRRVKSREGRFTGKNATMYGKHHSENTRKRMSEKYKGVGNPFYGKKHSIEWKQKKYKRVKCIETGEVFESIKSAGTRYDLDSSSISKCCRGKYKTIGGFHWRYVE